jgi:hypothetical protein
MRRLDIYFPHVMGDVGSVFASLLAAEGKRRWDNLTETMSYRQGEIATPFGLAKIRGAGSARLGWFQERV